MRIMHYTLGLPPFRTGGLTKYSLDLMLEQKKLNNDVILLYPGHFNIFNKVKIKKESEYKGIIVYEIINPLPVPLLGGIKNPDIFMRTTNKENFYSLLQEIKPDIIHLHTLMGLHKEFLEAAKEMKIKIVFTTHDYFGLCPKVNLFDHKKSLCNDFEDGLKCVSCNRNGYSLPLIYIMQSYPYKRFKNYSLVSKARQYKKIKNNKDTKDETIVDITDNNLKMKFAPKYKELRKYYLDMLNLVDNFHFNSFLSRDEYSKYIDARGSIIPISHSDISDSRKIKKSCSESLQITYLGPIDQYKGFYLLKDTLDQLKKERKYKWHLNVYGDSLKKNHRFDSNYYSFHGKYKHEDLNNIFDNTDVLIIPSIWKETFGFVGLEAFSHGIPIILSEFVGFKDLIDNYKTGIIFKPDIQHLKECLINILDNRNILEEINENILKIKNDFLMQNHIKELMAFYKKL